MPQQESMPKPSDRWIPVYFFLFFGALILVLVPMCILAVRTSTGVVTEHAYEKGLAYNKDIQAEQKQEALKWSSELSLTPGASGKSVKADFALRDASGHPVRDAAVTLWLVRPAQSGMDQKTGMKAAPGGHYSAIQQLPAPGLWEARISATVGKQNYQTVKRITVP